MGAFETQPLIFMDKVFSQLFDSMLKTFPAAAEVTSHFYSYPRRLVLKPTHLLSSPRYTELQDCELFKDWFCFKCISHVVYIFLPYPNQACTHTFPNLLNATVFALYAFLLVFNKKHAKKARLSVHCLFSSFSRFADLNSNDSKKINTSDPFLFIFPRLWKRRSDTNCLRQTLHAGNYNGGTFQSVCYLPGFCVSVGGFWDEPPSPNNPKKEHFYECLLRAFVDVLLPPCPVEP